MIKCTYIHPNKHSHLHIHRKTNVCMYLNEFLYIWMNVVGFNKLFCYCFIVVFVWSLEKNNWSCGLCLCYWCGLTRLSPISSSFVLSLSRSLVSYLCISHSIYNIPATAGGKAVCFNKIKPVMSTPWIVFIKKQPIHRYFWNSTSHWTTLYPI